MRVALTYDDGPSRWTGPILDALDDYGACATFFVLGCYVSGNERLLRRMVDEGHEIGNHGFSHRRSTDLSEDEFLHDLQLANAAIEDACDAAPRLWRPPYHATNDHLNDLAGVLNLSMVSRTVDPCDWARDNAEGIAAVSIHDLDIVNLHDGVPPDGGSGTRDRQPTVDATRLLLERLPAVDWVTVSEL